MDFFEQQERARKHTGVLVALFALAVLGLIGATYLLVASAVAYLQGGGSFSSADLWNWRILVGIGGSIVVLVGGAMLTRMLQLRAGGQVVAEMLGGRRVEPASDEPAERRLLNVVEEMALASGTPVPSVYVLDQELAINAFAAGHSPEDAVIGITRGALEPFTRDELQGVIAHEFSHILNGDMRLNIRLMGVLYGILVIGLVGWFLLRSPLFSISRSSRDRGQAAAALLFKVIGLVLVVLGWLGTLFGNLIKAAVSRQREYLADASAVQFTRNPSGIGGALMRIAGSSFGSRLAAAQAAEMSHMLFGEGVRSWFSTHPSLEARVRRIDPRLIELAAAGEAPAALGSAAPSGVLAASDAESATARVAALAGTRASSYVHSATAASARLPTPAPAHLVHARQLLAELPAELRDAAREPYSARMLVYAMLLSGEPHARQLQSRELAARLSPELAHASELMRAALERQGRDSWLPLVEMALPALSELSRQQFLELRAAMHALIQADRRVDWFEWVLLKVVLKQLEQHFGLARPARVRHRSLERLIEPCSVLLSLLAQTGQADAARAELAFEAGRHALGLVALRRASSQPSIAAVESALQQLAQLTPRLKRQLLAACSACIFADQRVDPEEAELLRAFASALDCPMPPLLLPHVARSPVTRAKSA